MMAIKFNYKNSLIKKLLFFFIVFAGLPTIVLGYLGYQMSERIIVTNSGKMMQAMLEQNIGRLQILLQHFHETQMNVADSTEILQYIQNVPKVGFEAIYYHQLQDLIESRRSTFEIKYINWYPYNMKGHEDYMRYAMNQSFEEQAWYQDPGISTGDIIWVPETINNNGYREWVITRYRAIKEKNSLNVYGILGLSMSEETISRNIYLPDDIAGQRCVVVDTEGRVIIDTNFSEQSHMKPLNYSEEKLKHGVSQVRLNDDLMFVTQMKEPETGWTMIYMIPENSLLQQLSWIKRGIVLLCLGYLSLATLFGVYMHRYLMTPIQKLVGWMRSVEQGDLERDERLPLNRGELAYVFISFRRLLTQVKSQIIEIKASEQEKREMEIKALNYQIRPHFIYNTMDSMKWKVVNNKRNEVLEMIKSFSGILRSTLSGESLVTLKVEVQHVRYYVDLEKIRYQHKFAVIYDIHPETISLKVPRLILQPVVENAIRHGLLPKEKQGILMVSTYAEKDKLVLKVTDNGPGFPENYQPIKEAMHHGSTGGIGLANIKRRLELYYGKQFEMNIQSSRVKGTSVTILLPINMIND